MLQADREKCTQCGGCAPACPADAITVRETFLEVDRGLCTGCGKCVPACPMGALTLEGGKGGKGR